MMIDQGGRDKEAATFFILAVLGTIAYFLRVNIPHTEAFIEGRWAFGFMGFALLRRWRNAFLLAGLLSISYMCKINFFAAFLGNMLYALPALVMIRLVDKHFLSRLERHWMYLLAWVLLILICYQIFNTPIVWAYIAFLKDAGIWSALIDGWHEQPFFIESLLAGIISASGMLAIRMHRELSQNRTELAITLDSIGDGVIATDAYGKIVRINSMGQRLTGWSQKAAYGRQFSDVFHIVSTENKESADTLIQRVLSTRQPSRLGNHNVLIPKNGSEIQIADSASPLLNENGELVGVVVAFQDMTAEYEKARELKESEEKYRILISHANDAIFVAQDELIKFPNPKTLELTGYTEEELANISFSEIIHPEDRKMVLERYRQILTGQTPLSTFSFRIFKKGGELLWVQPNAVLITWEERPANLFFLRDITQLKTLEGQLQQAKKMEAIGNLAGGVAHDYNNISSIIIGYSELALEKVSQRDPLYSDLKEILTAARRSTDITRQLLGFARKQTIVPKVIDLNEKIEGVLKMLRRLIGEDIDLAWLPATDLWPVKMDSSQINQILTNLCVNARDAIVDVGKITIETENITFNEDYCTHHAGFIPGDYVLMAVSDDGIGMSPETLDKIFDPFFTTKELGKGTGLGLATVYGIAKQNNGFINVYSEPGKGTSFKVYIPRHSSKIKDMHQEKSLDMPIGRGETIMLVEDDEPILNLGKMILEKLKYSVISANTPGEAIKLATEHAGEIDLLLTDVVMPEMNGQELSLRLKTLYPNIKTLFMSGYTANVISHRGVLEDGVYFIQKPFSQNELAVKVWEILNKADSSTQA
ncbi:MAG: PAS domain S-box protein [Bacteroidales bacterium]|nr:PAS domain S-box protein [Bacteroidales bacterium]